MFRRHYQKRSPNILFVIFRLTLSLSMLTVLIIGIYIAYKHFSGLDPLKLDPQAVLSKLLAGKIPQELPQQILGQKTKLPMPLKEKSANLAFRFLLVTDSHNDNTNLGKAIDQAKESYPDLRFIIGLGDYTEVGTIQELKNAKSLFDASGLRYFLIPGDHDLWDCRNKELPLVSCFEEVFGRDYQSFVFENFRFLLLNNGDNYKGFDSEQLKWITEEFEKNKETKDTLVFLHEPLFHPSSDHVMGRIEKSLKGQADQLIFQFKEGGVTKVFAGDIHFFSEYSEPVIDLSMVTIGAVTNERNPQAPRFAVVTVFEDGSTKVEDVEIK